MVTVTVGFGGVYVEHPNRFSAKPGEAPRIGPTAKLKKQGKGCKPVTRLLPEDGRREDRAAAVAGVWRGVCPREWLLVRRVCVRMFGVCALCVRMSERMNKKLHCLAANRPRSNKNSRQGCSGMGYGGRGGAGACV
jgi:hypothetical protein